MAVQASITGNEALRSWTRTTSASSQEYSGAGRKWWVRVEDRALPSGSAHQWLST